MEEPTALDVLPKSCAHFSSCGSKTRRHKWSSGFTNLLMTLYRTVFFNWILQYESAVVQALVLTVSPGRGLSWPSMTDILASWSSLLSVCTVLRAESISRGPQASWAFKHRCTCVNVMCAYITGCRQPDCKLSWGSQKWDQTAGFIQVKISQKHLRAIDKSHISEMDPAVTVPFGWRSWARPGRWQDSWHTGPAAWQRPGRPPWGLLTLQIAPSYFPAKG